jgi:hypothetical protein
MGAGGRDSWPTNRCMNSTPILFFLLAGASGEPAAPPPAARPAPVETPDEDTPQVQVEVAVPVSAPVLPASAKEDPPPLDVVEPEKAPSVAAKAAIERPLLRVAIKDLEGDVSPLLLQTMTESVVAEVRKLQGLSVIGMAEVRALIEAEAERQYLGCDSESDCMAEIAAALGAELLLIGNISTLGDEHFFSLKRLDQDSGETGATFTKRVKAVGNGEDLLAMVGDAVETLFPSNELRPGQARGVSSELVKRLNPPPLRPWMIGVGGGAAVLAGVVSVSALLVSGLALLEHQELATGAAGSAVEGSALRALEDRGRTADVVAIAAGGAMGVLGAVTVAAAFLATDWYGFGEGLE